MSETQTDAPRLMPHQHRRLIPPTIYARRCLRRMTRLRRNRARSLRHQKPARPIAMNAGDLLRVTVPSRKRNRKRRKSRRKPPRRNLSPSRLNWLRLRAFWTSIAKLYEARGIPPADAVRALFNAQRALQERPYEAIQQLARDFGVDLTQFGRQQAADHQRPGCAGRSCAA